MKVDRLVSIIMLLLEKERMGARELAEIYEVSPRTIYRDIDAINMAGIPVNSTSGVGGGFEILRQYKVEKKIFSANDLSAILMGLSGLSGMMRGDELLNALAKVKSFIPAEKAKEIELKANQIYIDLTPWMGGGNTQAYLQLIKTALSENRLLSFEYANRFGNKSERTVEPYQLVLKGSHWYCQAYCRVREDFRLFKLSRVSGLKIEAEVFEPREFQSPQLVFDDSDAPQQTEIRLRIHKSVMDRVLDYCTPEQLVPDKEEYYLVNFPFIENDYFYGILFSFGDKCECLEPPRVREEMRRRIRGTAALYGD